jgi:hypothetical protein
MAARERTAAAVPVVGDAVLPETTGRLTSLTAR